MINPKLIAVLFPMLALSGCSGGGGDGGYVTPPPPAPSGFANVDAAINAAYAAQGVPVTLAVYDRSGVKVHEYTRGSFSSDQRVAIASASKLTSGLVMLRLVEQGYLSLDSTTGSVLGWSGDNSTITLRHLLSFTSGLNPGAPCTSNALVPLAQCVQTISQAPVVAPPGSRYDYGSTHLHVAARMAEVVVGASWNEIFREQLANPLELGPEATYYTFPRQGIGTSNPLIAGGLRMTINEYARVLRLVFDAGQWSGRTLISGSSIAELGRQPFPNASIGLSPAEANGFDFKYGLTAWLECTTPATGCESLSSPGAFGFTPWIDRRAGYYAVLGMETTTTQGELVNWALTLQQQLKPLITSAIAARSNP